MNHLRGQGCWSFALSLVFSLPEKSTCEFQNLLVSTSQKIPPCSRHRTGKRRRYGVGKLKTSLAETKSPLKRRFFIPVDQESKIITWLRVGEGGLQERGAGGKPSPHSQTLSFCRFCNQIKLWDSMPLYLALFLRWFNSFFDIVTKEWSPGRATDIVQWPSQPQRPNELRFQRPLDRELLLAPKAVQQRFRSRSQGQSIFNFHNNTFSNSYHVGRYHNGEVTGSHFILFTICCHQVQELQTRRGKMVTKCHNFGLKMGEKKTLNKYWIFL